MSDMVEIKRMAVALNTAYLCPACKREMWMDAYAGVMWCLGNKQWEPPGTTNCPQEGFKFEIPRVELTLTEHGNPQVTAT